MQLIKQMISFVSRKKRSLALLAASLCGFFLFLQSSLGANNFLRMDSGVHYIDFNGAGLMAIFIIGFSAYVSRKTLINFGYLLFIFALPFAILKTFSEMVSLLSTMDGNALEMTSIISEFYAIFLVGCFLSACGYFIDERQKLYETRTLSNTDVVFLFIALIAFNAINIYTVMLRSDFDITFSEFWSGLAWLGVFSSLCIPLALYIIFDRKSKDWNFSEYPKYVFSNSKLLLDSSMCVVLMSAIFGAIAFYYTSQSPVASVSATTSIGFLSMFYAVNIFILCMVSALRVERNFLELDFTNRNWHIIEAYAFLTFMSLAPPTMWDRFSNYFDQARDEATEPQDRINALQVMRDGTPFVALSPIDSYAGGRVSTAHPEFILNSDYSKVR